MRNFAKGWRELEEKEMEEPTPFNFKGRAAKHTFFFSHLTYSVDNYVIAIIYFLKTINGLVWILF